MSAWVCYKSLHGMPRELLWVWIYIFCHLVFISFKLQVNQVMSILVFQKTILQLLYIASSFGSISWSTLHTQSEAPIWAVNWPLLPGPGSEWTSFQPCTPSTKKMLKITGRKVRTVGRVGSNLDDVFSEGLSLP